MVVAFHYFVDLCTDAGVAYNGEPAKLSAYEQASAAFIFFNFLLSVAATVFAVSLLNPCLEKLPQSLWRIEPFVAQSCSFVALQLRLFLALLSLGK
eukprot:scaffold204322_cov21-Tisochrysis_lutea.AAC.1